MKPILFVADLHLSDDTPDLNALFAQFLRDHAMQAAELYILGDLFEAWTGDDDDSATAVNVATQLREFSQYAPVYFIAGNRDFVLGEDYARRANMQILPEQILVTRYGQTVLLTHGDEWCGDDVAYLRYRKIIRHPWVLAFLRRLPQHKRRQIAAQIRAKSRARKASGQTYAISDVTERAVQAACTQYPTAEILVHGHTHRPNVHQHQVQERTVVRYVLPDWYDGQGGYLAWDETGWQMCRLPAHEYSKTG